MLASGKSTTVCHLYMKPFSVFVCLLFQKWFTDGLFLFTNLNRTISLGQTFTGIVLTLSLKSEANQVMASEPSKAEIWSLLEVTFKVCASFLDMMGNLKEISKDLSSPLGTFQTA